MRCLWERCTGLGEHTIHRMTIHLHVLDFSQNCSVYAEQFLCAGVYMSRVYLCFVFMYVRLSCSLAEAEEPKSTRPSLFGVSGMAAMATAAQLAASASGGKYSSLIFL